MMRGIALSLWVISLDSTRSCMYTNPAGQGSALSVLVAVAEEVTASKETGGMVILLDSTLFRCTMMLSVARSATRVMTYILAILVFTIFKYIWFLVSAVL